MSEFESNYSVVNRVLVIEDDQAERNAIKQMLLSAGFDVETAKDGGQAHASFTMRKPDLVLLDLILPNESGFEVCERMKQEDESIPVIIHTAIKLDDSRNLAERVGADEYLVKPVSVEELVTAIRQTAEAVWKTRHLESPSDVKDRIRFKCPHCNVSMKVRGSHRGRQLPCPSCGQRTTVPRT